jgi:spore germination cell wall hydrolase CwlJ-like protein
MKLISRKAMACYLSAITATSLSCAVVLGAYGNGATTGEQQVTLKASAEFSTLALKQKSLQGDVKALESEYVQEEQEEFDIYHNIAISIADPYVEMFSSSAATVRCGRLYDNSVVYVIEVGKAMSKVTSGDVTGYVLNSNLCFDDEAKDLNSDTDLAAVITSATASIYGSSNELKVIKEASNGEEFNPIGRTEDYIIVDVDGTKGYIKNSDVSINFGLDYAITEAEVREIEAREAEEAARIAEEERLRQEEEERARQEEEARQAKIAAAFNNVGVSYNSGMSVSSDEAWLLACVIDWEASGEPYEGKLAVANVILNRVRSPRFGNTIASVVYAKSQFSGVSDGNGGPSSRFESRIANGPWSSDSLRAASEALSGVNNIGSYTSFRATSIANLASYSSYTIIGNHCFFA